MASMSIFGILTSSQIFLPCSLKPKNSSSATDLASPLRCVWLRKKCHRFRPCVAALVRVGLCVPGSAHVARAAASRAPIFAAAFAAAAAVS